MSTETYCEPAIVDDSGYRIRSVDLAFLGIAEGDVANWSQRKCPLGMTPDLYDEFVRSLLHALRREGVLDADVRIQGSSTHFFSGAHKAMPYNKGDLRTEYMESRSKPKRPGALELEAIESAVLGQWPDPANRPLRRPFDALYRVGVHPDPSDFDVQISSSKLIDLICDDIRQERVDPATLRFEDPRYNFVKKYYVDTSLLYISAWKDNAAELVGRPVTVALFDQSGPPESTELVAGYVLSSHFKDDDWIVTRPVDGSS